MYFQDKLVMLEGGLMRLVCLAWSDGIEHIGENVICFFLIKL